MRFQAVKGTRDFYPEAMRLRNWICEAWRRVSLRNGFEEYDTPIFEYLELFTAKSGQEIAEQLFNFTDRGGRRLAIRPEITPSLARMVNAKISSLPRPIKWFSVPRLCRAENPQKGRLREFFQWNVDIIGSDDILADAECIFVAVDFLREMDLTPEDVCVRIGSRPLTVAALRAAGVGEEAIDAALAVLDKRPKVPQEDFHKLATGIGLNDEQIAAACRFQDCSGTDEVRQVLAGASDVGRHIDELESLWGYLKSMGAAEFCRLDMGIVRGLAYYTGVVYEIFDAAGSLRAIAGGGRYDNLLQMFDGPAIGATGFGMGDVVLSILLTERHKLPGLGQELDFFVIDDEEGCLPAVLKVVAALRAAGWRTEYSLKRQKTPKQLKEAVRRGAAVAVFLRRSGAPVSPDGFDLTIKNLRNEKQYPARLFVDEFLRRPELKNVRTIEQFVDRFGLANGR